MANKKKKRSSSKAPAWLSVVVAIVALIVFLLKGGVINNNDNPDIPKDVVPAIESAVKLDLADIPEYTSKAYVVLNGNEPYFTDADKITKSYEYYSKLDKLGRCGITVACLGKDLMPTESRGDISSVKPTGWHSVRYDNVDGNSLYNRCHLIGFQLAGENANEKNLITGTRYLNVIGMLPFENMVADYIKETGNHVMYRVIPVFKDNELVARGVQMEGYSVEDEGDGICFNVFCYNVQPGIEIEYSTGESKKAERSPDDPSEIKTYILNTNSKKFHDPSCSGLESTKEENKQTFKGTREELIAQGYKPCGSCNP